MIRGVDMRKKRTRKSLIRRGLLGRFHECGNGFRGHIVKAKEIEFCGFCGKEFRK